MTIVTGNETFPEQNITKEDFVPDDVTMVKLHIYYYLFWYMYDFRPSARQCKKLNLNMKIHYK